MYHDSHDQRRARQEIAGGAAFFFFAFFPLLFLTCFSGCFSGLLFFFETPLLSCFLSSFPLRYDPDPSIFLFHITVINQAKERFFYRFCIALGVTR